MPVASRAAPPTQALQVRERPDFGRDRRQLALAEIQPLQVLCMWVVRGKMLMPGRPCTACYAAAQASCTGRARPGAQPVPCHTLPVHPHLQLADGRRQRLQRVEAEKQLLQLRQLAHHLQ